MYANTDHNSEIPRPFFRISAPGTPPPPLHGTRQNQNICFVLGQAAENKPVSLPCEITMLVISRVCLVCPRRQLEMDMATIRNAHWE